MARFRSAFECANICAAMTPAEALSQLCQQCGMCCDGSLFTFLPMSKDEAARMQLLGARTKERRDGRWAMLLRCHFLEGCSCTAYATRPSRCREFVCSLGRALEGGEESLEGALTVVGEAKARLRAVEEALPPNDDPKLGPIQRGLRFEAREPEDAQFKRVRALTREAESFLARHFTGGR